jgi:hypothetical protein
MIALLDQGSTEGGAGRGSGTAWEKKKERRKKTVEGNPEIRVISNTELTLGANTLNGTKHSVARTIIYAGAIGFSSKSRKALTVWNIEIVSER